MTASCVWGLHWGTPPCIGEQEQVNRKYTLGKSQEVWPRPETCTRHTQKTNQPEKDGRDAHDVHLWGKARRSNQIDVAGNKRTQKHAVEWGHVHIWSSKSTWCCKMMSNILFCMVNYISVSTDTLEGVKRGTKRAALCPRGQVHRTQQPGVRWMRAWRRWKALDEGNRMAMFFGFETVHKQSLRWLFVWMFVSLPAVSWKKKVVGERVNKQNL